MRPDAKRFAEELAALTPAVRAAAVAVLALPEGGGMRKAVRALGLSTDAFQNRITRLRRSASAGLARRNRKAATVDVGAGPRSKGPRVTPLLRMVIGSARPADARELLRFVLVACTRCGRLALLRPGALTCIVCREGRWGTQ